MTKTSPEATRQVVQGDDASPTLEQQARMDLVEFLDAHHQDPDMMVHVTRLIRAVGTSDPGRRGVRIRLSILGPWSHCSTGLVLCVCCVP